MLRIWKSFSGEMHPQNQTKQNLMTRRQDAPPTSKTLVQPLASSETSLGLKQPAPSESSSFSEWPTIHSQALRCSPERRVGGGQSRVGSSPTEPAADPLVKLREPRTIARNHAVQRSST